MLLVGGSIVGSTGPAAAQPARAAAAPGTAETEQAAVAAARTTGLRTEVLSERTEVSQIFAEPTGRLTYEAAAVPQRVRQPDGSWKDVRLALTTAPDGSVRPEASVADVRFSPDGKSPLATLVSAGRTMSLSWPFGKVTAPTLAEDSATYSEVLPGVDLVLRATWTGFSHVLVVKTPQAATNSALREIRFDVGGDGAITRLPDGSLRAVAAGTTLASAPPPAMWDSSSAGLALGAQRADGPLGAVGGRGSSAAGPGDTAKVASVTTQVTADGDLLLRPEPTLLAGPPSSFPLYIDPAWSKGKSRWAYATGNNSNNTDTSVARVGADPDSGKLYRSFFEFPTTELKGRHVESAYVQMVLDHSWSCTNSWTHMYHSGGLSGTPRTKWATPLLSWLTGTESHANEGRGCSDSPQPDMTVNFSAAKVTSLLQTVANKGSATVTMGFCACNADGAYENKERWKKFLPNKAKLIADVDFKPGKPHGLQVAGIACTTGTITIGDLTPKLSAVFPDGDKTQAIAGTWEWVEQRANGTWDDTTPRKTAPPRTSAAANTRRDTADLTGVVKNKSYAFRVKGTDPAPYGITGAWSDWCRFTVDTSVPQVQVSVVTEASGPGRPATFRISSTAADVAKFRYGWTEAYLSEATPAVVTGVPGKSAQVTLTVPRYGLNVLYVKAVDATLNEGYASTELTVERGSPAVARWGLETYPGLDDPGALADQQPALAGDTPLTPTGVTWQPDVRLVGGRSATFSGAGSAAVATGPVVDASQSFSVGAWVRPQDLTGAQTVVAKDGGAGQWSPFRLQLSPTPTPRWCMTMNASLTGAAGAVSACSTVAPTAGRWTHVAGSYDRAARVVRVWVDGVPTEVPFAAAVSTAGPVTVGRAWNAGAAAEPLRGNVADVQVYDRVLVAHDFTGQSAADPLSGGVDRPGVLNPITTGRWDFDATRPCYNPTVPLACQAPDRSAWARRLTLTQGVDAGDGHRGLGLDLDGTYFPDEVGDPLRGTPTREQAVSQRNAAPGDQPEQWRDDPVLRTAESFTVSVWVRPGTLAGTMTAVSQLGTEQGAFYLGVRSYQVTDGTQQRWSFMTMSKDDDLGEVATHASAADDPLTVEDTDPWTHLVAVWDTGAREMRLYVNGRLAGTGKPPAMFNAAGPVLVGADLWSPDGGPPAIGGRWTGGVDDLAFYQGAMSAAQVAELHTEEAQPAA